MDRNIPIEFSIGHFDQSPTQTFGKSVDSARRLEALGGR